MDFANVAAALAVKGRYAGEGRREKLLWPARTPPRRAGRADVLAKTHSTVKHCGKRTGNGDEPFHGAPSVRRRGNTT
jgi:hypothetical protein